MIAEHQAPLSGFEHTGIGSLLPDSLSATAAAFVAAFVSATYFNLRMKRQIAVALIPGLIVGLAVEDGARNSKKGRAAQATAFFAKEVK